MLPHLSAPLPTPSTLHSARLRHLGRIHGYTCHLSHPAAPVYTARQIEGIRAACVAGREVLDLAAAAVRPGVTTDELDRVVCASRLRAGEGGDEVLPNYAVALRLLYKKNLNPRASLPPPAGSRRHDGTRCLPLALQLL